MTDTLNQRLRDRLDEALSHNKALRRKLDAVEADRLRLHHEVQQLRDRLLDQQRAETEAVGTFPAPPKSDLGVTPQLDRRLQTLVGGYVCSCGSKVTWGTAHTCRGAA